MRKTILRIKCPECDLPRDYSFEYIEDRTGYDDPIEFINDKVDEHADGAVFVDL